MDADRKIFKDTKSKKGIEKLIMIKGITADKWNL
jgi:hypothetical protein